MSVFVRRATRAPLPVRPMGSPDRPSALRAPIRDWDRNLREQLNGGERMAVLIGIDGCPDMPRTWLAKKSACTLSRPFP